MMKMVKKMRINLIFSLCIAMSLVAASSAMAATITFTDLNGVAQFDGEYVGAVSASLDSNAIAGGVFCVDIALTTYVPSTFGVAVSTLQPFNMTTARHTLDSAGIFKYEEAAWLRGQISSHSDQVGVIQFAVWDLFNPSAVAAKLATDSAALSAVGNWLTLAGAINPQNYDFSSVRIYTPTAAYGANQEFMSGAAIARQGLPPTGNSAVPIPASFVLLGSGLLGLGLLRFRRKAAPVRQGRDGDLA